LTKRKRGKMPDASPPSYSSLSDALGGKGDRERKGGLPKKGKAVSALPPRLFAFLFLLLLICATASRGEGEKKKKKGKGKTEGRAVHSHYHFRLRP